MVTRGRMTGGPADLTSHQRELTRIVDSASDAIVSGELDGTILTWNAGAERLYGYTAEEMMGEPFTRLMPSGDLPRGREMHSHALSGQPIPEFEAQALRKDGTLVDVSMTVSPILGEDGRLAGLVAIARGVGERRRADTARLQARQRFAGAFANAPIGMALVSLDGRFIDVNDALAELLGRSEGQLRHLTFQEITHPEDLEPDLDLLGRLIAGTIPRYELEKRYLRPDGTVVWGQLCVSLVCDSDGEPHHFVSQIKDITVLKEQDRELRRLAKHLDELSMRDPLTDVGNLRGFDRSLRTAIERGPDEAEVQSRFCLVVFDVDDLKGRNAELGRIGGDRELRRLAAILSEEAASGVELFRIGGDEFAMLLDGAGRAAGAALAARVGKRIEAASLQISVTPAVVTHPADGRDRVELLCSADVVLRAARPSPLRRRTDGPPTPRSTKRGAAILETTCEQLGVAAACLSERIGRDDVVRIAGGDAAAGPGVGERLSGRPVPLASVAVPRSDGGPAGTLHVFGPGSSAMPSERELSLLQFLGGLLVESLSDEAREAREHTAQMELSGITALVAALEARDHYTAEHSRRVVDLARGVARRLALGEGAAVEVESVAVLHDIGKVAVPDAILQKGGPLIESEWELMRQHPAVGERIVASTQTLTHLAAPIRAEHEHFDGSGYPDGLSGERIPIASRITLACDAYHAMTSTRPYRAAMNDAAARAELLANAGTQFDPDVVAALLEELSRTERPV